MENKKLFASLMSFALTILIFATSIFAWYSLSDRASTGEFVLNVIDLKLEINLKVTKNDQAPMDLKTHADYELLFSNSIPSDEYLFQLTIINKSTRSTRVKIALKDIFNANEDLNYDLRNVYYIKDGITKINNEEQTPLVRNNTEELEPIFDQELNVFNLNNLIVNNNILLLANYLLDLEGELTLEFLLVYDQETSALGYQSGRLEISAIYIYND